MNSLGPVLLRRCSTGSPGPLVRFELATVLAAFLAALATVGYFDVAEHGFYPLSQNFRRGLHPSVLAAFLAALLAVCNFDGVKHPGLPLS